MAPRAMADYLSTYGDSNALDAHTIKEAIRHVHVPGTSKPLSGSRRSLPTNYEVRRLLATFFARGFFDATFFVGSFLAAVFLEVTLLISLRPISSRFATRVLSPLRFSLTINSISFLYSGLNAFTSSNVAAWIIFESDLVELLVLLRAQLFLLPLRK